jgi:hypothetical protein
LYDCRYLLCNGFNFVLTRRLNSDPLELLFSSIRQSTGSCDATTATGAMYSLEKSLKLGLVTPSSHSSVACGKTVSEIFSNDKNVAPASLDLIDEDSLIEQLIEIMNPKGKQVKGNRLAKSETK